MARITQGSETKERKLFTWYDINRILRKMQSPEIPTGLPRTYMSEYFACASSLMRVVEHFSTRQKEIPNIYYHATKDADLDLFFTGIAGASMEMAELSVRVYFVAKELRPYR